ncbi:MAG: O-methyltransferase [Flavobacteriales bacterium]|nr:O-methyltransferase [Flavobacteriales bacterium]
MEFLEPKLDEFVVANSEKESQILQELARETGLKAVNPRMLAGHLQGRTLSMLSHMIQPTTILEIGTFTGYSAICLAEGLVENGKIITIDINEELENFAKKYFVKAGIDDVVEQRIGDAIQIIPELNEKFDLVFIDADKTNYANYFDLVFPKLRNGGYIIADNVLWSGKVLEKYSDLDPDTKAIVDFNKKIQEDERVQNVLFPIRDGIQVIRKK